jgi:hypothetical protein
VTPSCQQRQLAEVTAVERELANLALIDQRGDRRLPRRHQRRVAADHDALGHAADLHLDVERGGLSDGEIDVLVLRRAEAGQLHGDGILAGHQRVGAIASLRVGDEDPALPGVHGLVW